MLILGIETSCDETAASVIEVQDGRFKVRSNIISSQIELHAPYGGVFPALAAREHVATIGQVTQSALSEAKVAKPDLVAVTSGPGLISSLLVGTTFAQTYAWQNNLPIIGTNHIEGHIYANWLSHDLHDKDIFPAVCLVVSGGHTQLILMKGHGDYQLIGQTLDDAAGEAFDKIARILELGYPGGPKISQLADSFDPHKRIANISLPRPMLKSGDFNFSFSGLKTAVLYTVRDLLARYTLAEITDELAYETQEAIVETLVTKTIRAAQDYTAKSILLAGGVSANQRLRDELSRQSEAASIPLYIPDRAYTTDNAAMIATAGYFNSLKSTNLDWKDIQANANWEIV